MNKGLEKAFAAIKGITILKFKANFSGTFASVRGRFKLKVKGIMLVGNHFSVIAQLIPVRITVEKDAELIIGENVFLNNGVDIGCTTKIIIGNNVKIGPLTNIIDCNFHEVEPGNMKQSEIIIEDNVWIGRQSIILPGIRIGKNSVICAGAVVNKDVPENSMVAGVPGRVVRKLDIPDGWVRR